MQKVCIQTPVRAMCGGCSYTELYQCIFQAFFFPEISDSRNRIFNIKNRKGCNLPVIPGKCINSESDMILNVQ